MSSLQTDELASKPAETRNRSKSIAGAMAYGGDMRSISRYLIPLLAILWCASAGASVVTPDSVDTRRCELEDFLGEISTVSGVSIEEARAQLAVLADTEVDLIHTQLASLGNWQALPQVMSSISEAQTAKVRERLSRMITEGEPRHVSPTPDEQLEQFRADFLFMLDQMAKFEEVVGPEFGQEIQGVRWEVESAPAAGVQALQKVWLDRSWELESVLAGAAGGNSLIPGEGFVEGHHTPDCDKDCGDIDVICWIDEAGCWIGAVGHLLEHIASFVTDFVDTYIVGTINKIAALPGEALKWFQDVFADVASWVTQAFADLVNLLPNSVEEVLAYLGINWNDVNWETIAGSVPTIAPPCPEDAVAIAAEVCDRGGDALTQLLYDLAPDDGLSFVFKLGAGLIHYPLAYLCQCNDIAEAIAFANAQADHRDHTETNLDLQLSTRATQTSMDGLALSLLNLEGEVFSVESKLDTIEVTVDDIETNVNTVHSISDSMHIKIDALTSGNADQQDWLADFDTLMTRLNIEENLLENKPDTISMFQLPEAWGGRLETVALVVADTIQLNLDAGQDVNGAERELQRGDGFRLAGDFARAYEAYRSAYREAVR